MAIATPLPLPVETVTLPTPFRTPVEVPVEPTTPMKPSEAMRLGAMSTEQAFVTMGDGVAKACALGAMMIGYGHGNDPYGMLYDPAHPASEVTALHMPVHPEYAHRLQVGNRYEPCPHHGCRLTDLTGGGFALVVHLNDLHKWPRNKIADWLETLGL